MEDRRKGMGETVDVGRKGMGEKRMEGRGKREEREEREVPEQAPILM